MVFIDSGFLIALIHSGDQNRESALEWMQIVEGAQVPLLTTEFHLLEVVDFLSEEGYRAVARQLVTQLRSGALVTIVPCSTTLLNRGLVLHGARDDKGWSLTDCIGILVMEDHNTADVLTYDHDFVQAGKHALPLI